MKDITMNYHNKSLYEAWLATTMDLLNSISKDEEIYDDDYDNQTVISQSVFSPVWRAYSVISRIYNDDMKIIQ